MATSKPRKLVKLPSSIAIRDQLKTENPDCVVIIRMGDFYEAFRDDARFCASRLGLTLTAREKNQPDPVPMVGFPYWQLDAYVNKLLDLEQRVIVWTEGEPLREYHN